MKANKLLEWHNGEGKRKSLLWVVDNDRSKSEVDYQWLETATFDGEHWNTDERLDFIQTFEDYGIPDEIL